MMQAIREHVTFQKDGVVELRHPEIPAGTEAEVIIMLETHRKNKAALTSFIGKGKGCFKNEEEVDTYIKKERNSWE